MWEAAGCTMVGVWRDGGGGVKRAGAVGALCRALDERAHHGLLSFQFVFELFQSIVRLRFFLSLETSPPGRHSQAEPSWALVLVWNNKLYFLVYIIICIICFRWTRF